LGTKIRVYRPYKDDQKSKGSIFLVLIVIPLALSAFTHLWNPIGFPYFHGDEGHYMRRAVHVLDGLGPQEPRNVTWSFEQSYDHPYFGQLFLAGALGIIGYPDTLDPKISEAHTIEILHLLPRLFMGTLAIVDTFLIYKIAERRYGRNVAFIAAILFAVMPMSWLTRRILLDSLFLPFLLTSILFALKISTRAEQKELKRAVSLNSTNNSERSHERISGQIRGEGEGQAYNNHVLRKGISSQNMILLLSSGIFLGLAIFTKVPAITLIPLVGFIVFTNNKKSVRALGLWIIPVILIPLIWPAYAMLNGEFGEWLNGLYWQAAERSDRPLWKSISDLFKIDSVLLLLGISAVVYASIIKRDSLIILWFVPLVVFLFIVNHSRDIYWIPAIPLFCIAAAVSIVDLSNRISSEKIRQPILLAAVSAIGIFGLVITAASVSLNLNETFFEVYTFVAAYIANHSIDYGNNSQDKSIMMGSNWAQIFSWIPKYIFDNDHDFKTYKRYIGSTKEPNLPIKEGEKVLLLVDNNDLVRFILSESTNMNLKQKQLYNETMVVARFNGSDIQYGLGNYLHTTVEENPTIDKGIEIRSNY
jgi:Dolichyl-phosphate-mannose-protein mannosyltransferase